MESIPMELLGKLYPGFSMVQPEYAVFTIDAIALYYKNEKPANKNAVVVECGVHRGGMSVLLARLFPDKKIYMCDSFEGFEPYGKSQFSHLKQADAIDQIYNHSERHRPGMIWNIKGEEVSSGISEEKVKENLLNFGLVPENHGLIFVPGFVGETLPELAKKEAKKIACLRIDVDAYAATYECLHYLYDNVVEGGIIIFDDYTVGEAGDAIKRFVKDRKISINPLPYAELGCYIVKSDS